MHCDWVFAAPSSAVKTHDRMRRFHRREPQHQLSMEKSALRFLLLTAFFEVALCGLFGRTLYFYSRKSWSEAREFCRRHYTDLSSINSKVEDNTLLRFRTGWYQRAWIGLYKDDNDTWKWSGGENASFFNWAAPSTNSGRCVAHDVNGWYKMNCEENKLNFYCFKSNLVLVKENMTWEEAMEHCRQQHTDLISLPTRSALFKSQYATREAQMDHLWIGLRYLADSWLWVNGHKMKYRAWRQGETPQCPALRRRCGALSLHDGHWDNWDCTDKLNFVCY